MSTLLAASEHETTHPLRFQDNGEIMAMEVDTEDEYVGGKTLTPTGTCEDIEFDEMNLKVEPFDEDDDIKEAKQFLFNNKYSENENIYYPSPMGICDSLTDSILLYFQKKLPLVSVTAMETPSSKVICSIQSRQDTEEPKGLNLKNYNAYEGFTAKELESRLNNVTVTPISEIEALINSSLQPHLDCLQLSADEFCRIYQTECEGVEFASSLWFYMQYMKCVDNPSLEICQMAAIAATAASAAYHSAADYGDSMSLPDLLLAVAIRAALNVLEQVEALTF